VKATDKLLADIQKLGYEVGQADYKDEEEFNKSNFSYRYWRLPNENFKLKDTPFFYNTENDFIHFTTLDALYSIINNGHIRLYNLLNMDDKLELEYARKELLFRNSNDIDKEQLFCFSMCSSDEILKNEIKEHLLWKLHGRNGSGVIIRFNVQNNLHLWYNFHLTKMFYNLENFDPIKELNTKTDNEFLDAKLACFLKLPIYEFENEIRLVFDNRNPVTVTDKDNETIYPIIYPDKLHKSDKIFYFQLPLLNFRKDKNDKIFLAPNMQGENFEIPKISIAEIILGYRYSDSDLKNIQSKIDSKLTDINIKITALKKYY
jgi:hypothetical protein